MLPSVTSSGSTMLTFIFDPLARGTHPCVHFHLSDVNSTNYFDTLGFHDFGLREFLHQDNPLLLTAELSKCQTYSWKINDPDLSLINGCDLITNSSFLEFSRTFPLTFSVHESVKG
jgi:hypothetical protein